MHRGLEPGTAFEVVKQRHRLLFRGGLLAVLAGVAIAGVVGYDWYIHHVSHEVLAVIGGFGILVGVQLLILSSLSSLLLTVHAEFTELTDQGPE